MKKYPKKYYTSSQQTHSNILAPSTDILSLGSISSNHIDTTDIIHLLIQQVICAYNHPNVPQMIVVTYDSLFGYLQSTNTSQHIHTMYAHLSPAIQTIKSLGLLRTAIPIVTWQVDYRMMVKSLTHSLLAQGVLRPQKVSYFWDLESGISIPERDVSIVPRALHIHRLRYFIDSKKESVVIHTHTPHTIFADVALAVNPTDRRYRKLVGKKVIIPIINRIIPIIADETVDATQNGNGIKRVTPCHDYHSSLIAQRHGLPLDIYAYNAHGIFTEHAKIYAGKKAVDFFDNIIQYLQDIHNYDGSEKSLIDLPFSKTTQHYLDHFLIDGWVVSTDTFQQSFIDLVGSESFVYSAEKKQDILVQINQKDSIAITASHGTVRIPTIDFSHISGSHLLDYILSSKKSQNTALALAIHDVWYDGFLPTVCSIEQIIDLLLYKIDAEQTLLASYCHNFLTVYASNARIVKDATSLLLILEDIEAVKTTSIDMFVDLLDNCIILEKKGSNYSLVEPFASCSFTFLDTVFLSACAPAFLYSKGLWTGSSQHTYVYQDTSLSLDSLLLEFVLYHTVDKKYPQISIFSLQDNHQFSSKSVIDQCIKPLSHHSLDTIRFALASDNLGDISASELIVQKIWNVCRYVYMQVIVSGSFDQDISSDLGGFIQENSQQLTPFDQWIIYRFGEIVSKLEDVHDSLFSVQYKISHIMECVVDDFAVKYIEIIKQRKGPLTDAIMLLCVNQLCHFLYPIMPELVAQIRNLFGEYIGKEYDVRSIILPSKNYKIHLLMMIIGGLKNLKSKLLAKNHEFVDVCIQASTDMNHFIQEYHSLLDNIIHINDISFYTTEQEVPSDYLQEHVIDIVLGIKLVKQTISETDRLYILLREKSEYLQHLRALASISSHPDKELKIDTLKAEIQNIEYQIMKSKNK